MTHPTNREVGNVWTAYILGQLFEQWPRRVDFNAMDISVDTKIEPKNEPEELFDDLAGWLRDNGYIAYGQDSEGNAYAVSLTDRGFAALGTRPEGLDQPLGTKLKEAVSTVGSETRTAVISKLVEITIGAAISGIKYGGL